MIAQFSRAKASFFLLFYTNFVTAAAERTKSLAPEGVPRLAAVEGRDR
jgi:hypothetical protein